MAPATGRTRAPARRGETRGHANEHSTCYGAQHQPSHTQHDWLDRFVAVVAEV